MMWTRSTVSTVYISMFAAALATRHVLLKRWQSGIFITGRQSTPHVVTLLSMITRYFTVLAVSPCWQGELMRTINHSSDTSHSPWFCLWWTPYARVTFLAVTGVLTARVPHRYTWWYGRWGRWSAGIHIWGWQGLSAFQTCPWYLHCPNLVYLSLRNSRWCSVH